MTLQHGGDILDVTMNVTTIKVTAKHTSEVMNMKIAVIGANGKAGQLIVKEAVERGIDVTAIVRSENKSVTNRVINKDLYDLTTADLEQFDAVVDAFGAWTPETLPQHSTSLKHLCDILSGKETRLLVVGGAGSLYVNPEHTMQVMETPAFNKRKLEIGTRVFIIPACTNTFPEASDSCKTVPFLSISKISTTSPFFKGLGRT